MKVPTRRNEKGVRQARVRADAYLLPTFRGKPLASISRDSVRLYHNKLEGQRIRISFRAPASGGPSRRLGNDFLPRPHPPHLSRRPRKRPHVPSNPSKPTVPHGGCHRTTALRPRHAHLPHGRPACLPAP